MPHVAAATVRPSTHNPSLESKPGPLDTTSVGGVDSPVLTLPGLVLPAGDRGREDAVVPLPEPNDINLPFPVGDRVGWLSSERYAPLMSLLMMLIQDMLDQRKVGAAMRQGARDATKAALNAERKKLEAEKKGLAVNMLTSITAAVVGGTVGGDIGKALGETTRNIGEYVNKAHGPQAEADRQELVAKRWEMMKTMFEPVEEDAKAALDAAREEFNMALRIIRESEERNSQVIQRVTGW